VGQLLPLDAPPPVVLPPPPPVVEPPPPPPVVDPPPLVVEPPPDVVAPPPPLVVDPPPLTLGRLPAPVPVPVDAPLPPFALSKALAACCRVCGFSRAPQAARMSPQMSARTTARDLRIVLLRPACGAANAGETLVRRRRNEDVMSPCLLAQGTYLAALDKAA